MKINGRRVYIDPPDVYRQWLNSTEDKEMKPNLAATEYTHPSQQLIQSHWPTVEPVIPEIKSAKAHF